jgi:ABC-type sugar transport system permease subunit
MATYVYKMTFGSFRWAYGMALATTVMIAIFALSQVTNRALFRETVEF